MKYFIKEASVPGSIIGAGLGSAAGYAAGHDKKSRTQYTIAGGALGAVAGNVAGRKFMSGGGGGGGGKSAKPAFNWTIKGDTVTATESSIPNMTIRDMGHIEGRMVGYGQNKKIKWFKDPTGKKVDISTPSKMKTYMESEGMIGLQARAHIIKAKYPHLYKKRMLHLTKEDWDILNPIMKS